MKYIFPAIAIISISILSGCTEKEVIQPVESTGKLMSIVDTMTVVDTSSIGTGTIKISTGMDILNLTGINLFNSLTTRSTITFPKQPILNGSYQENTDILHIYAYKNQRTFDMTNMPEKIQSGFLYITLRRPLTWATHKKDALQTVLLDTSIDGINGRLDTVKTPIYNKDNQYFLYDLSNIKISSSKKSDWRTIVNGMSIKGFVGAKDNGIESITISQY